MEININGINREVQIVPAPRGSFYMTEEGFTDFPLFVGICNAIGKEFDYGEILICPISDVGDGYATTGVDELKNTLRMDDFKRAIKYYNQEREYDDLQEIVEDLMDDFNIHDVPISRDVRECVEGVLSGRITEIPDVPIKEIPDYDD